MKRLQTKLEEAWEDLLSEDKKYASCWKIRSFYKSIRNIDRPLQLLHN